MNEIDRAQGLDPNSPSILADKGRLLWVSGRTEQALRLLRQLEAADPDSLSPHRYLKFAYLEMGDYPGYLAEMKKEAFLLHDASLSAIGTAAEKGFAAHGATGMFEGQLEQQNKAYRQGNLSPFYLAERYSACHQSTEGPKKQSRLLCVLGVPVQFCGRRPAVNRKT